MVFFFFFFFLWLICWLERMHACEYREMSLRMETEDLGSIWFAFWMVCVYVFIFSFFFFLSFFFFFFWWPAPGALFMRYEQCIKRNEQYFLVWTVTENYFFIIFNFQQVVSKRTFSQLHIVKKIRLFIALSFTFWKKN